MDRFIRAEYVPAPLDSPDARILLPDASAPDFAPPDYLLFRRAGSLMAQRFDFARVRPLAEPVPIVDRVDVDGTTGYGANFSVSKNGVLVYCATASAGTTRLTWRGRDGGQLGSLKKTGDVALFFLQNRATSPVLRFCLPHNSCG
jgi:hypothetical protein